MGITVLSSAVCLTQSQLSFGGSSSGSSSSSSSSSTSNRNGNTKLDTDQRIISTGNQFIDGGLLGVGAGLLGGAVLGGALNGGSNSQYNPCGRRKRQADDGKIDTRFLGALLGGGNKLLTRMMLGPGFLVFGTSWVEAATTTAAATVATSQPIPTLATTIPPTISSSSVSATII